MLSVLVVVFGLSMAFNNYSVISHMYPNHPVIRGKIPWHVVVNVGASMGNVRKKFR